MVLFLICNQRNFLKILQWKNGVHWPFETNSIKDKAINLTLSILNGSIEKAWVTKKTAAERMIIRDTMIIEP